MLYNHYDLAYLASEASKGREVLYHGTQSSRAILKTGKLLFAALGDPVVCFTQSPDEAARWASLNTSGDGRPAILIFDRRSLACRYRIEPYCDDPRGVDPSRHDEMEERIWCTDVDISAHLIGFVSEERVDRKPEERRQTYEWLTHLKCHPGRSVRSLRLEQCKAWAKHQSVRHIAYRVKTERNPELLQMLQERLTELLASGDQTTR